MVRCVALAEVREADGTPVPNVALGSNLEWIFGTKRLIPAGTVTSVDHDDHNVYVAMTKDQIKGAPDYDANDLADEAQRKHGDYYRSSGF